MSLSSIRDGLNILLKYSDKYLHAEHDEIWAGTVPPDEMEEEDRAALEADGWDWDKRYNLWHRFV